MTPAPAIAPAPRGERRAPCRGFTLLELMAVMALVGVVLMLVPPNLESFGDSSRLKSAANTMVSVLTAARELAIIDGHETVVQYDLPGDLKDREKTGRFRYIVSARKRQLSRGLREPGSQEEEKDQEPAQEWIETSWNGLPAGVILAAYSEQSGEWVRSNPKGEPVEVTFLPDGTVRPAHALRLVSVDIPAGDERTITVRVNSLTSTAEAIEGEAELPRARDPNDFR